MVAVTMGGEDFPDLPKLYASLHNSTSYIVAGIDHVVSAVDGQEVRGLSPLLWRKSTSVFRISASVLDIHWTFKR